MEIPQIKIIITAIPEVINNTKYKIERLSLANNMGNLPYTKAIVISLTELTMAFVLIF